MGPWQLSPAARCGYTVLSLVWCVYLSCDLDAVALFDSAFTEYDCRLFLRKA
jgi:hypothetical protein